MRPNQVFTLTPEQTKELKAILISRKSHLPAQDFSYVWLKVNREQAVLTQRQLHRFALTLVENGYLEQLPNWYQQMLEPNNRYSERS